MAALLFISCVDHDPPISEPKIVTVKDSQKTPNTDAGLISPREECRGQIDAVKQVELSEALDMYYRALPMILIGARIVPVIYFREPKSQMTAKAAALSSKMDKGYRTARQIKKILRQHKEDKPLLREVFLKEGYLFETRPKVALALIKTIILTDLFDEDKIYGSRSGEIIEYVRGEEGYADKDGEPVSLVLNDRFALSADNLKNPLHWDLLKVREITGARRILPIKISASGAASVKLVYPNGFETEALLSLQSGQTTVSCIAGDDEMIREAHLDSHVFWEWTESLYQAARSMVLERPGFDEPKDEPEEVQEDGKLRIEWKKAYYKRKNKFKHRDEEYRIFDRRSNPTPPQVCIDFIFDTWERASGNWYNKRGVRPGRSKGFLNFKNIEGLYTRHTSSVLNFAKTEPGILERMDFSRAKRVPFKRRKKFAEAVAEIADFIREGDLLVIHGLREEDMEDHFHTIMVLWTEPLTGIPMIVADNAGRPRIRNLASSMRSAPRRSIKNRLRINPTWLAEQRASFTNNVEKGF